MSNTIRTGTDLNKMFKAIFSEMTTGFRAERLSEDDPGGVKPGKTLLLGDTEDDASGSSAKPTSDDDTALAQGEIPTKEVIEKLNSIRAGRSFRDSAVKDALEQYIDKLDTAEKTALFAFLKGIAQIVTGEIEPTTATEPSDPKPAVSMEKKPAGESSKQKVTIKPTVVKKPSGGGEKKSIEDTSPPITPKKK